LNKSETWIDRLKNFEAKPPANLWAGIEDGLDREPGSVSTRLQAFEVTPPSALWDRIEQDLDADVAANTPVIELPRKRRSLVTYLAAAAIITVVLLGTALLLNEKPGHSPAPIAGTTPGRAPVESAIPTKNNPATEPNQLPAHGTTPKTGSSYSSSSQDDVAANADYGSFTPNTNSLARATASLGSSPMTHHISIDEDRYLVRAYNNGSTVRFSKKVSAVMDCAELSTGFSKSLCVASIGAVQEKLATYVNTDFGGLIERLQQLEIITR
jgi:hypothetical protein